MRAARMGLEEVEEVLKEPDFQINESVTGSENHVLRKAIEHGQTEVVKLMLEYKADPNIGNVGDSCPAVNHPPLHAAAMNGFYDIVKLLLDAGANINVVVDGRKAKTVAKDKATYQLIRDV